MPSRLTLVLCAATSLSAGCQSPVDRLAESRSGAHPADLVVANAEFFTALPSHPRAEAIAVKEGRIAYVGDVEGARDFVGADTRIVDGGGGMVIPGLVDPHCHPLYVGGLRGVMGSLYEAKDLGEMSAAVKEWAAKNEDLPFVLAIGWRLEHVPGGNPAKDHLDSLIADRPVFLWSYDGHSGWVNSLALARMRERNPVAFRHVSPRLDDKGEPTGYFLHFFDFSPFDYFTDQELGDSVRERIFAGMRKAIGEALRFGVTTLQDIQISRRFLSYVLAFRDQGGLDDVRMRCALYIPHYALEDEAGFLRELEWWRETGRETSSERFRLGESTKLYADGVFSNQTARLAEPYRIGAGSLGDAVWREDEYARAVEAIDRMGIQVCTHGCGDDGIRRILDGYEKAIARNGMRDARHSIEHCEFPSPADQRRMAALGVYASMQPVALYADEPTFLGLGIERLQRYMPWRSMKEAGVPLAFGSDWCAAPFNPLYGLLVASLRYNYQENSDWGPEERLEIAESLECFTIGGARCLHWEDEVGSLEVGKRADFSLWEIDLREADSLWFLLGEDLELGGLDDFVRMTFVDGRLVYEKRGA